MSAPLRLLAATELRARTEAEWMVALKDAIERLPRGALPLGLAGPNGGAVDDSRVVAAVRGCVSRDGIIEADVAVFFQEVVAGCSCGDEPMPLPASILLRVQLDAGGVARFTPLDD